jgi:hypothetical protein
MKSILHVSGAAMLIGALVLGAAPPVVAAGAHEHGVARLDVVIDGANLQIALDSPLEALVGFEQAPKDDAQRAALARMVERLKDGGKLFAIDPAAACALVAATVEQPFQPGADAPADGHADADANWTWRCEKPAALKRIEVRLFEAFAGLKTLHVQTATANGQGFATLTKSRRAITF